MRAAQWADVLAHTVFALPVVAVLAVAAFLVRQPRARILLGASAGVVLVFGWFMRVLYVLVPSLQPRWLGTMLGKPQLAIPARALNLYWYWGWVLVAAALAAAAAVMASRQVTVVREGEKGATMATRPQASANPTGRPSATQPVGQPSARPGSAVSAPRAGVGVGVGAAPGQPSVALGVGVPTGAVPQAVAPAQPSVGVGIANPAPASQPTPNHARPAPAEPIPPGMNPAPPPGQGSQWQPLTPPPVQPSPTSKPVLPN